jgi:hypothetical protein
MISELEKVIDSLKGQLNVKLTNDDTIRFEEKREEFFSNIMRAINILKTINSKFKDILPLTLDINQVEEDLKTKVTQMNTQLIAQASKKELSIQDSDEFRKYYYHLSSFEKHIHLPDVNIKATLEESKEKILEKIAALHQEIALVKSDVMKVSIALCKMKFFAENLSMFDNDVKKCKTAIM